MAVIIETKEANCSRYICKRLPRMWKETTPQKQRVLEEYESKLTRMQDSYLKI